MTATLLILLLPITAEPPAGEEHAIHQVDCIIINRVTTISETEPDAWGRTRLKTHEITWVSFWEHSLTLNGVRILWCPFIVDRGWCTADSVLAVVVSSDGWMIVTERYSVAAPVLLLMTSPYDWEMRNRRVYLPIP